MSGTPHPTQMLSFEQLDRFDRRFVGALTRFPGMENIAEFPIVLIPMYGVAITGSLSVMTLHRITVEYREEQTRDCDDSCEGSQAGDLVVHGSAGADT
ncbi:MAG: hypothetical protein AAGD07_14660 [Planctomycetota bacterium]